MQDCSWLLDRAATFLQVHGRLGEARPLSERALAITEAVYGPDHPIVGTDLSNLALILRDLGEPFIDGSVGQRRTDQPGRMDGVPGAVDEEST